MPRTCKISIRSGAAEPREVVLEFSDAEWQLLIDAERYAAEVDYPSLAQKDSWQTSLTIAFEEGVIKYSGRMPDWDEVIVVLHRLRPLILESEPTYFHTVLNVVARRAKDSGLRDKLKALSMKFSGRLLSNAVTISANDEIVNSEAMLKKFLNAYEFHRDADKRAELEKLFAIFPSDAAKTVFVHLLIDKLIAVHGLEVLIGFLAGKHKSMRL